MIEKGSKIIFVVQYYIITHVATNNACVQSLKLKAIIQAVGQPYTVLEICILA